MGYPAENMGMAYDIGAPKPVLSAVSAEESKINKKRYSLKLHLFLYTILLFLNH